MTTENNDLPRPEGHRAVPADEAAFCGTGAPRPRDDERSREERDAERERQRVERERQRAESEAKLRKQLREDCITACETWDYNDLLLLDATVNGLATIGVMREAITGAMRNVTEERSAATVLAEMLRKRRMRDEAERTERENEDRAEA